MEYIDFLRSIKKVILKAGDYRLLTLLRNVIFTRKIDTMATNSHNVFINPSFVEGLTEDEVVGVLWHELYHDVLDHHHAKWRDYNPDSGLGKRQWYELANVAADVIINDYVRAKGKQLPKEGQFREDLQIPDDLVTSHQIFNYLLEQVKKNNEQLKQLVEALASTLQQREQDKERVSQLPKQRPDPKTGAPQRSASAQSKQKSAAKGVEKEERGVDPQSSSPQDGSTSSSDGGSSDTGTPDKRPTENNLDKREKGSDSNGSDGELAAKELEELADEIKKLQEQVDQQEKNIEQQSQDIEKQKADSAGSETAQLSEAEKELAEAKKDLARKQEDLDQQTAELDKQKQELESEKGVDSADNSTSEGEQTEDSEQPSEETGNSEHAEDIDDKSQESDSPDVDEDTQEPLDDEFEGEFAEDGEFAGDANISSAPDAEVDRIASQLEGEASTLVTSVVQTELFLGQKTRATPPPPVSYVEQIAQIAGSFLSQQLRGRSYHRPDRRSNGVVTDQGLVPILPGKVNVGYAARIAFYLDVSGSMYDDNVDRPNIILDELRSKQSMLHSTGSTIWPFNDRVLAPIDLSKRLPHIGGSTTIDNVLHHLAQNDDAELFVLLTDCGDTIHQELIPSTKRVIFVTNSADQIKSTPNVSVIYVPRF